MRTTWQTRWLVLLASAVLCTHCLAQPGQLTPPDGPVHPTMLPLDQMEPRTPLTQETTPGDDSATFVITEPGSYYLVGNVTAPALKDGIRVEAECVAIDMRGFSVVLDAVGPGSGVVSTGGFLRVSNGCFFLQPGNEGSAVVAPDEARIEGLTVYNGDLDKTAMTLIEVGPHSHVSGCVLFGGGSYAIRAGTRSRIVDCSVFFSQSGVLCESGCIVEGCTIASTNGDLLIAGAASIVRACVLSGPCRGSAIVLPHGGIVEDCTVSGDVQNRGIDMGGPGRIDGCDVSSGGIRLSGDNARLTDTVVVASSGTPALVMDGDGCVVSACRLTGGNIQVNGARNTLDGNTLAEFNTWSVGGSGNVVRRNQVHDGGLFDGGSGNLVAPFRTDFSEAGPWDNFDF